MEENVALDSTKQKKFVKSIKGIKKLIKKNEKKEAKSEFKKEDEEAKPQKPFSMRLKPDKKKKQIRKERGLVYLSHIPHGFYEHQMTQYFKQFGVVTNARVIKSKRTGNSKGYAFVEFKEPSVAQIVAETMNNYLMGKRLIKAVYIPPEKQRRAFRKHWNSTHNPTSIRRLQAKKAYNQDTDEIGDLKKAQRLLSTLNKTKKRLSELGINYDFFLPVDVPEALLDSVIKQEKTEDTVKEEHDTKPKKEQKVENGKTNDKKTKKDKNKENNQTEVNKKGKQENKEVVTKESKENKPVKLNDKQQKVKGKDNKPVKVNEKQQKEKEQTLKDAGVKSVEEFISLNEEDSDGSCDFDSDEYEKMLNDDDDDLSSGASDESGDEEEESGEEEEESGDEEDDDDEESDEEEEEVPPPKKGKGKPPPVVQPIQNKKQIQKQQQKQQQPQKKSQPQKQVKKQELQVLNETKRKAPQKPPVPTKKPKFEKQNQKPLKKQFKKK